MHDGPDECVECDRPGSGDGADSCCGCDGSLCHVCSEQGVILCSRCGDSAGSHIADADGTRFGKPAPQTYGWARLRRPADAPGQDGDGTRPLRRGGWYAVLNSDTTSRAVFTVAGQLISIPSRLLEFRRHRPERFAVVVRDDDDANPAKGTSEDLGRVYAVCPEGCHRVRLEGHPDDLSCEVCGIEARIAWGPAC